MPSGAPEWFEQLAMSFPKGRTANFLVCQDRGHMAWTLNLSVIDWLGHARMYWRSPSVAR